MISNIETATRVSELMLDIFRRVDESVAMVRAGCTEEEAGAYSQAVGRVAGAVVMDVLEPLYERNPSLKPANLGRVNDQGRFHSASPLRAAVTVSYRRGRRGWEALRFALG